MASIASPRVPESTSAATPTATAAITVPAYGMKCSTPVNAPHIPAFGSDSSDERRPSEQRDEHVRDQQCHHVRWICASISFNTSTVTRRRASDSPASLRHLAPKRIARGKQEERQQHCHGQSAHHDQRLGRPLGDQSPASAPSCCSTAVPPREQRLPVASAAARSSSAAAAFMCVIGTFGDERAASAAAYAAICAPRQAILPRVVQVVAITYAIADTTPTSDDITSDGRPAAAAVPFQRGYQRPQRIAQQDSRDDRERETARRSVRRGDDDDDRDDDRGDFDGGQLPARRPEPAAFRRGLRHARRESAARGAVRASR